MIVRAELQFTEATFEVKGEFLSLFLGIPGGGLVGRCAQGRKSSTEIVFAYEGGVTLESLNLGEVLVGSEASSGSRDVVSV